MFIMFIVDRILYNFVFVFKLIDSIPNGFRKINKVTYMLSQQSILESYSFVQTL